MAADLSGDDIKIVRYSIQFTKRGFEAVLEQGEEAINYATDEGSISGLVLSNYLAKRSPELPPEDKKYLRVKVEVLGRFPPDDAETERKKIEALREIRDKLE